MSNGSFVATFADLPTSMPIFPLPGAVLMPHAEVPLNVFEPRYLNMVDAVLGSHRMICCGVRWTFCAVLPPNHRSRGWLLRRSY